MAAIALCIGRGDETVCRRVYGHSVLRPQRRLATFDTVFDLASLTKPLSCAASIMLLSQQGRIPLTNMLAPGAMGESRQVGNSTSAEGQAENRRVVARILQNKGITGASGSAP